MDQPNRRTETDNGPQRVTSQLHAEVATCLPAFAVLRAQLGATAKQIEQAVIEVCQRFQGIVGRARESVTQAASTLGNGERPPHAQPSHSQRLIAVARRMMERSETTTQACLHMVDKMGQVEGEMNRITQSLREVDEIAKAVRLLGFNATIEAARAGEHGATFSVVAAETRRLATNAAQINKSIQKTVEQLRTKVNDASQELRVTSTAFVSSSEASCTEVNEAVAAMAATEEELRRSVECSARVSESLADDVSHAVMAMQFQDRVNQQITHVVDALEGIEARLAEHFGGNGARSPAEEPCARRNMAEHLTHRYTMQSERDVHTALVESQANHAGALGDNVELF